MGTAKVVHYEGVPGGAGFLVTCIGESVGYVGTAEEETEELTIGF